MSKFYIHKNVSINLNHVLYVVLKDNNIYFYTTEEMSKYMYKRYRREYKHVPGLPITINLIIDDDVVGFYIKFNSEKEASQKFDKINGHVPECDDLISF
jgi:hypothetical protein